MRRILIAIVLLLAGAAQAQFTPGQVLTATELNNALATPTIVGGSIDGAVIGQNNPVQAYFNATSGTALTATGNTSGYAALINGSSAVGQSRGLIIKAGTNSSDYSAAFQNQAGANLMTINGAGDVLIGPPAAGMALTVNASSSGSPSINPALTTNQWVAGTNSAPTTLNEFKIWQDNVNAANGSGTDYFVTAWNLDYYFGGSSARGGREELTANLYLTAATSASSTNRNYVAITGNAIAQADDGGTNPSSAATSQGAIFGGGFVGVANNGATSLLNVTGSEFNVAMQTGSSVWAKTLAQFSARGDDAVAGSGINAMLWLYNQSGSNPAWTTGILFDNGGGVGGYPFNSSSSVLKVAGGTVGNVIDVGAAAVSSNIINAQNALLSGAGALQLNTAGTKTLQLGGDANGALLLGQVGTAQGSLAPYLDFHTGSSSIDARLQADASNQLSIFSAGVKRVLVGPNGNVSLNASGAALATNATAGFTYLPSTAGAPSGVPAATYTGSTPVVVDTTDNRMYFYNSGWQLPAAYNVTGGTISGTTYQINGTMLKSSTAPTISSGFGSSPSIASNNGTATFRLNVGTGGSATGGVIGMPTAANGWNCQFSIFNPTATNLLSQTVETASNASSVTVSNLLTSSGAATAWPASTVLIADCLAY